jgi:cation diffusion facilitator family transporter
MKDRTEQLKRASWIGILGNSILAALKIVVGFLSGSFAVIGDGIDTLADTLSFIITLHTARIIAKPPDSKYPYGYKKAETISTKILSFIIFFAGAQLLISTAGRIIEGEIRAMPSMLAIYVTLISILGKSLLARWQFRIGKRNNSSMILANAKNMQNDILISASVLVGLIFTFVLNMPLLDLVTAMLVALWIIRVAFKIFLESNLELMDGVPDANIYDKIFQSVESVKGAYNPHRIRVRQLADLYLVGLDIEVDKDIKVEEAHEISKEVENKIRQKIPNLYDVLVHIEPRGNIELDEVYGISEENIKSDKKK